MNGRINRAVIVLVTTSVLVLVGCSAPGAEPAPTGPTETIQMHADYPVYSTLDGAEKAASTIVKGKLLDSRVQLLYPDTSPTGGDDLENPQGGVPSNEINPSDLAVVETVNRIEVTEVIKGETKVGDTIEVAQPGGEREQVKYTEENTVPLAEFSSTETVLFLDLMPDGYYDLINPQQGVYTVDGDALTPTAENNTLGVRTLQQVREAASN